MILAHDAANPAFADGKLPKIDLDEVVAWARSQLGLNSHRLWRVISARRKLSKVLFEIEESREDSPVRLIAKISSDERTRTTFDALCALWTAGFCPPSRYTVVEPVAYFPERDLIILERAPGRELIDFIEAKAPNTVDLIRETARWLARLHSADVPYEPWCEESYRTDEWTLDLDTVVPDFGARIRRICEAACHRLLSVPADLVPCHGDFHPLNMFVSDDGRMTGIDIDKFGGRDRAEEVAYFLAQLACIGFHRLGSFADSVHLRREFLNEYTAATGVEIDGRALGPYMALTYVKNLHFDLFTYRSGRTHIVDEWLCAAERCLAGDIHFA